MIVGDLVYLYSDTSKLKTRDKYMITSVDTKYVEVQKFTGNQFRGRTYRVQHSDLIIIPNHRVDPITDEHYTPNPKTASKVDKPSGKPSPRNIPFELKQHYQPIQHPDSDSGTDDSEDEEDTLYKYFMPNKVQLDNVITDEEEEQLDNVITDEDEQNVNEETNNEPNVEGEQNENDEETVTDVPLVEEELEERREEPAIVDAIQRKEDDDSAGDDDDEEQKITRARPPLGYYEDKHIDLTTLESEADTSNTETNGDAEVPEQADDEEVTANTHNDVEPPRKEKKDKKRKGKHEATRTSARLAQ